MKWIIDKSGNRHLVRKYILNGEDEEEVWCSDWYGHHKIGFDCEWETPSPTSPKESDWNAASLEKLLVRFAHWLRPAAFETNPIDVKTFIQKRGLLPDELTVDNVNQILR